MKHILFLLLSIFIGHNAFAQVQLQGKVIDKTKNSGLQDATIQLLNLQDSTIRTAKSVDQGAFSVDRLAHGDYQVQVTLLGYKKYEEKLKVQQNNPLLSISLEPGEILIEEINIEAPASIAIKGDTMEFNARNFATRQYADADEMVSQVPGVTVDEDGNVSAHGEEVKRILVDGKEFFSTDPKIALKNLPADIIDKIQLIDEKSEQARFSGFDDGKRNKVINIVTKPDKKKGYFGKANAGKGDSDKFTLSTAMNAFKGDQKIGINIMANNLNETEFHQAGGGSRRGNNNVTGGISDTYAAGANYSNTFLNKKMEVNGNYRFRSVNAFTDTYSDIEYLMGSRANQFQNQHEISDVGNTAHNVNARVRWEIDSLNRLDFTPNISYQKNDRIGSNISSMTKGGTEMLNNSDRTVNNSNNNFSYGAGFTYMRRLKHPGQTISLNVNANKSSNEALGKTLAFNEYYQDAVLNRIDTNDRESTTHGYGSGINTKLAYTHNITKLSRFQANYGYRNTNNYSDRKTMEFLAETGQYEELNERLSNAFRNDFNHHSAGLSYSYNKRDTFRFQIGLNYEHGIRINDRTVPINLKTKADFGSFLPEMTMVYFFNKQRNLEFNYNTATNTPSINQLQDYIDNSNELMVRNGNPNLDQEYNHNLRLQFRDVNRQNGRSFNSNLNFSYINNKIINSTMTTDSTITLFDDIILGAGGQYIVPENVDGEISLRSTNSYGLPIKKWGINLNLNNALFYNRKYAILNKVLTPNHGYGLNQRVGIASNFSRKVILGLDYGVSMNFTNNPQAEIQHYKVINHYFRNKATFEVWKDLTFGYDLSYYYNDGLLNSSGTSTTLMNAFVGYKILKAKNAEIALRGFDLFNNATNINRRITEIAVTDIQSNTLNRYFLLSLTYNLRSFGSMGSDNGDSDSDRRGNRRRNR